MKVLSDKDVLKILNQITREGLIGDWQPHLLRSLLTLSANPTIVPPRVVQASNTGGSDSTHLFMPCIGDQEVGIKLLTGGPTNTKKGLGFIGSVAVIDENDGSLVGVLNARHLTAFRTALASSLPLIKIVDGPVKEITVIGSGLQAFWHAKLALILFQSIERVIILNRSTANGEKLKDDLIEFFPNIEFSVHGISEAAIMKNSSIIFGCLPSTEPLIKREYLIGEDLKYVNLIGSYKPHMLELERECIEQEFLDGTKIIVDSKQDCLIESGELIGAAKKNEDLVEIAEFCTAKNPPKVKSKSNIVVLKLVGISVMDISTAKFLLQKSGSSGTLIDDF